MRHLILPLLVLLLLPVAASASPPPQTHPWRIAVGGAYCTGYVGLLALHGLPRERVTEQDLGNIERLREYDMVLVGMRGFDNNVSAVLEQYVREGGVLVAETGLQPSPAALPGQRLGPAPHPNLRFVNSGSPLTQGLPELGLIPCVSGNGLAIIPDASTEARVLAEFSEEQTPPKFQGRFRLPDGRMAPAIIAAKVGEGWLVYSAVSIAFNMSLRGDLFGPFVCNVIRHFSNGEVDDRMFPGAVGREQLATVPPEEPPSGDYPAPAGAAVAPPQDLETLADPGELRDFALTAKLPANGSARLLVSYWSPAVYRELVFDQGQVTLQRQAEGKPAKLATGKLPAGEASLLIVRRSGLLTVEANRQVVLAAHDGPPQQGALAAKGLTNPEYQPLDLVYFRDDFMRETTSGESEWQRPVGTWVISAAEGKPEMGANPFDYAATANPNALALNGDWFWTDYAYDASVKPGCAAAGIVAHWRDDKDFLALRLSFASKPAKLQLVRVKGTPQVLGECEVDVQQTDWHRLGLRVSGGIVEGMLDGEMRLQARQPDSLCGRIGLYCEKGQANFDDIAVRPWTAAALAGTALQKLLLVAGDWKLGQEGLEGSGSRGARAFPAWGESGGDCTAAVDVRVGQAAAAGLHFRYVDNDTYYLMALMNDKGKLRLRLFRQGDPGAILVEKPVAGDTAKWHKLQAEVRGGRLFAAVDGQPVIDVLNPGHRQGMVGLYARGVQPATFRNFTARQVEPDEMVVDELTPSFAGIIDRHTWAGRSGAWTPDPADLNCFWHSGYLPADFRLDVGIHPGASTVTKTALYVGRDHRRDSGYTLMIERNWAATKVPFKLLRLGTVVAQGEAPVTPGQPFAVGLARRGKQLMIEVNQTPAAVYGDENPPQNVDGLGLEQTGSLIYADDIAVYTPLVHDYTFETAPTDWAVQSGMWEITSRWSCTPGWAWFSGANPAGYALISTKAAYAGDQDLVMYVAPKMMPAGDSKRFSESWGDVYLSLCSGGGSSAGGYQLAVAGATSAYTVLRKQGQIVAQCGYRLPTSGMHNDWIRITLRKRGPRVSAWVWDVPILEWDDSEPLSAGRIGIGTANNGIIVPRVTVFGRRVEG